MSGQIVGKESRRGIISVKHGHCFLVKRCSVKRKKQNRAMISTRPKPLTTGAITSLFLPVLDWRNRTRREPISKNSLATNMAVIIKAGKAYRCQPMEANTYQVSQTTVVTSRNARCNSSRLRRPRTARYKILGRLQKDTFIEPDRRVRIKVVDC